MPDNENPNIKWYVLRDLKRANSKSPAYKMLPELGFEVFTPMEKKRVKGKNLLRPVLSDLLFVHTDKATLDPVIDITPTLQYRYLRGGYRRLMIIPNDEMDSFIKVAGNSNAEFHSKIPRSMIGRKVRFNSGPFAGVSGHLVTIRGRRNQRLMVEIEGLLSASVEVHPEDIDIASA